MSVIFETLKKLKTESIEKENSKAGLRMHRVLRVAGARGGQEDRGQGAEGGSASSCSIAGWTSRSRRASASLTVNSFWD